VRLELRDVAVAIGGCPIVQTVNATVDDGAWLGVLGPNGAGKTTLLRAVAGLAEHTGTVLLDGTDTAGMSRKELAARVAVVAQKPVVPDGITVADYVLLGRTPHIRYLGGSNKRDLLVVREVLDALDLGAEAPRRVSALSGGEAQRVFVARALAQEPSVLLLDEPTTSLDVGRQQDVLELVERLRRERDMTVVSALHDLSLAGQFADRLLLLHEGVAVASGTPADVLTEEIVREFYGAEVRLVSLEGGDVIIPVRRDAQGGATSR
jgi:iron complex transport system ATP-binding protein